MIRIRIPGELPRGGALRVTIHIGTLGFNRSEYFIKDRWAPNSVIYVDEETNAVSFESSVTPNKIIKRKIDILKIT